MKKDQLVEEKEDIAKIDSEIKNDTTNEDLGKIVLLEEKIDILAKSVSVVKEDINDVIADLDDIEEIVYRKAEEKKESFVELDAEEFEYEKKKRNKSSLLNGITKDLSLVGAGVVLGFIGAYILLRNKNKFH